MKLTEEDVERMKTISEQSQVIHSQTVEELFWEIVAHGKEARKDSSIGPNSGPSYDPDS